MLGTWWIFEEALRLETRAWVEDIPRLETLICVWTRCGLVNCEKACRGVGT